MDIKDSEDIEDSEVGDEDSGVHGDGGDDPDHCVVQDRDMLHNMAHV